MPSSQDQIKHLLIKLEILVKKQDKFAKEIQDLRQEIYQLRNNTPSLDNTLSAPPITDVDLLIEKESVPTTISPISPPKKPIVSLPKFDLFPDFKEGFEKFIGENLLNKIGITVWYHFD